MDRRGFLTGAAGLGALAGLGGGLALPGCAVPEDSLPSRGGALRLGMTGGSTSDSLDPRTFVDWVPINIGYQIMNGLVEIDAHGTAVPELFQSWEAKPGAAEWMFKIRPGVVFHNGKTLDADDVVYSINLHRGNTTSAAQGAVENILDVRKVDPAQVQIVLRGGDAELPATLADYRLLVVPDGFTDWANPIGTGAYKLETFEPGVRCVTTKVGSYWKPDAGHVEAIEVLVINDAVARANALISGQVDIINRIDGRTADLLKRNKHFQVIRSQTGQYAVFAMNCESDLYGNNDVRLALKYAIDRERIIKTVLNGYGTAGNDQPIPRTSPYYNTGLEQRVYDPDRARFHLKKAGKGSLEVTLQVSEAAFSGAVDAAVLYQAAANGAGVTLNVKREPADGYWSSVWMRAPFCASYSDGRATVDGALSKAYKSTSVANDSRWRSPDFDRMANEARAELDPAKRKALYGECQRMIRDEAGALIPMFIDHIEAGTSKVQGWKPSAIFDFMGQRIGEKVWLAS